MDQRLPGNSSAPFALALVGVFCGWIFFPVFFLGVPAGFLARAELRRMKAGEAHPGGLALVQSALVLSVISVALGLLVLVFGIALHLFLAKTLVPMIQDLSGGISK